MLTHLSIQNLTLVDHLELEFNPGMSAITGETGAGKSIMLGALGLALGDRADSSLIATQADKAEICASFDLSTNIEATAWLNAKELNDDNACILRRVVSADGRSRAFVNGSSMTLTELRELSEMLLDIHSQHEHQSLLKKETHRRLLDEFGGLTEVVNELTERFERMTSLSMQLENLKSDAQEQSARVQLLSYQSEELTSLNIAEDELEDLEQEQKRLNAADQTRTTLTEIISLCSKDDETSASSQTSRALSLIYGIDDTAMKPVREMLESALIQLDEAITDLSINLDRFNADPERLAEIEKRLGDIYDIARKHRINPEQIPALTDRIKSELDEIANADTQIAALEVQLEEVTEAYHVLAEKLSSSRVKTARLLESDVTEQLQALGMSGASFSVSITAAEKPHRWGTDLMEFLISTVPGVEPGSLARIASGGELSRISLAIQVITAKTSDTPTLVFDEVDVGVGGATAEVVGSLLRKLGSNTQVICVTHLPQVAAQGHHHYVVSKETTDSSAATSVTKLTEEEKVDEIARMLGGVEQTEESLAHAQSMLSGNQGT
ncbi:MAG: DNA repair protein RecN [Gammaproteobacteria bacterium]|nr:DNA repair protein RecN [Gammaproteobacteria bacterium]